MSGEQKRFHVSEILEGEEVASRPWKWGSERDYVVADSEGNHWMGTLQFHREDGLQDHGAMMCKQVRKVERTVWVWEDVSRG